MKKEIETRADIELLVDEFYKRVKKDEVIGYIFNNAVNFSWEKHIPVMYSFWESMLLDKFTYKGSLMMKHLELDEREQLKPEHFARWKKLFFETLDAFFEGEKADEAKKKVESMEQLMQFKIEQNRKGKLLH